MLNTSVNNFSECLDDEGGGFSLTAYCVACLPKGYRSLSIGSRPSFLSNWGYREPWALSNTWRRTQFQNKLTFCFHILINLIIISSVFAEASNGDKLIFIGNKNIPPIVYLNSDVPAGVCVDIVHAIEPYLSQPIEIKAMDWLEAQGLVARGEADALIQINESKEREKIFDFSDSLLESQFSIFTRTDKIGVTGLSGLRGLRVGVEAGGLPRQLLEKNPQITLAIIPDFIQGFNLLNVNDIDAVVVDYQVGTYIIANSNIKNIKVTGEPIAFSYSSIAVKKGNTKLLDEINNALRKIKADGTYGHILDKWKPEEVIFQTREQINRNILHITILVFVVFSLLTTAWLVILKKELIKRKTVEETLSANEALLRLLFENAPLGMAILDSTTGRFLSVNPRLGQILGYTPEELLNRTFQSITHPDHLAADLGSVRELVSGTVAEIQKEKRYLHRSGKIVWGRLSMVRLPAAPGDPPRHISLVEDITEWRQGQEERRKFETRLNQIQKLEALGVLVAGVAHNFNNILAVIMGAASLRERRATDAEDQEAYQIIGKACRRGREVVKSLIKFAQPSLSSHAPFELHALIREVRVFLESTARSRIQILEVFSGEPLWLEGDAGSISTALLAFCLNSLDAMPNGGTLTFRTATPEKDWTEVSIEDSGAGMNPETLRRVTEPFFTTKDVGTGMGLGVSMAHGVIKAHGGSLGISSLPGRGTIVKLRFPRLPAPDAVDQTIAAEIPRLGHLTVLVVDDDADIRALGAWTLKQAGCLEVKTAASGEAALELLREGFIPNLIILDQNMPKMDGIQTMAKVLALHPEMRILISSGQPDIEEWPHFKQPNVAVIAKPFEMEELLAKLAQFAAAQPG